ncbi:signal peptidase complex subunit 1 family protein [Halosolutus halophilus]|uniref:signal peptidase complex subunit 1 family protein n=1 Tax=Halosolutus halophilus TaxID=1552990 RepID=UPI002234FF5B|nr:signal peptidase complex subunit 1 family protein [Halosolutus halophilus]
MRRLLAVGLVAFVAGYGVLADRLVLGTLGAGAILVLFAVADPGEEELVSILVDRNRPRDRAERLYDVETHAETLT